MKFTINRSKWRCGGSGHNANGQGRTQLLNEEGYRCCLGFVEKQLEISDECLLNMGEPSSLEIENILSIYDSCDDFYCNTKLADMAICINDDLNISYTERESKLIGLFKEYGHEIIFEGEYENN